MTFKDHFSHHAIDYARYRPDYPAELFEFLASVVKQHDLAWDCGTGNGQAALQLAGNFDRVIATDPSEKQIQNALPHEKISYVVATAEATSIPAGSVDLITVAQALHWFDFESFYREVLRVLKPQGILAVWCYGLTRINPTVDGIVQHYYKDVIGPFWPPERRYIDEEYRTVPFPFAEIPAPAFQMQAEWNLNDFTGYLRTWSATQRFQKQLAQDPLDVIYSLLAKAWGPVDARLAIRWPIYLRLGSVTAL